MSSVSPQSPAIPSGFNVRGPAIWAHPMGFMVPVSVEFLEGVLAAPAGVQHIIENGFTLAARSHAIVNKFPHKPTVGERVRKEADAAWVELVKAVEARRWWLIAK